jgi:hypothetical protein
VFESADLEVVFHIDTHDIGNFRITQGRLPINQPASSQERNASAMRSAA